MPKLQKKKNAAPPLRPRLRRLHLPHPAANPSSSPLDPSQGRDQTYKTEDCPVCCHPNIIHVESDPDWTEPRIWAESE